MHSYNAASTAMTSAALIKVDWTDVIMIIPVPIFAFISEPGDTYSPPGGVLPLCSPLLP
jgi:hypothetical protein